MSGMTGRVDMVPGATSWPWAGRGCSPERDLWVHVLYVALRDALEAGRDDGPQTFANAGRRRARDWVLSAGADFRMVCTLAGVDPAAVREAYVAGRIDPDLYYDKGMAREAEA